MKKVLKLGLIALLSCLVMAGCGDTDAEYLKDIKKMDKYVTLGQYKGLEAQAKKTEITDEYVDRYVQYLVSQMATYEEITGRSVKEGDLVSIDYAGYMDDEAFEGGTGSYDLEIGSGSFIDGFEEGLIGANVGDTLTLDLTFPDPYTNNPDLSGKPVKFDVTINAIKEMVYPELTEELVANFGIDNVTNEQELKAFLRSEFEAEAESSYRSTVKEQMAANATANATVSGIPEKLAERQYQNLKTTLNTSAQSAGMGLEEYLTSYYGISGDAAEESIRTNSDESTKQMLVFKAIADAEGIAVSKMDVEDYIAADAEKQGITAEQFKSSLDMDAYEEYVLSNKVLDYLVDQAVITEPAEDTEE